MTMNLARGFVIIESLVALLVLSLGAVGLTSLQGHALRAAGDSKARSEALALARAKLDELRNNVLPGKYAERLDPANDRETDPERIQVDGITYERYWRITRPYAAPLTQRISKVEVWVDWNIRSGAAAASAPAGKQRVQLDSTVAWSDPVGGALGMNRQQTTGARPGGGAQRGTGTYTPGMLVSFVDGTQADDKVSRIKDTSGATIIYLEKDKNGTAQKFTPISGRVYLDEGASNMPASDGVFLRMSAEGQCIFDNRSGRLRPWPEGATGSNIKYKYFTYTCYVGTGWYGNIGVQLPALANSASVCVGDPAASSTSGTTSPHAQPASARMYRGFMDAPNPPPAYITTGMAASTAETAYYYGDDEDIRTTTNGGGLVERGTTGFTSNFKHDFLVTRMTGNTTCADRMSIVPNTFRGNSGRGVCITPDDVTSPDRCPAGAWPGF